MQIDAFNITQNDTKGRQNEATHNLTGYNTTQKKNKTQQIWIQYDAKGRQNAATHHLTGYNTTQK